jgi:hypothetical protein
MSRNEQPLTAVEKDSDRPHILPLDGPYRRADRNEGAESPHDHLDPVGNIPLCRIMLQIMKNEQKNHTRIIEPRDDTEVE